MFLNLPGHCVNLNFVLILRVFEIILMKIKCFLLLVILDYRFFKFGSKISYLSDIVSLLELLLFDIFDMLLRFVYLELHSVHFLIVFWLQLSQGLLVFLVQLEFAIFKILHFLLSLLVLALPLSQWFLVLPVFLLQPINFLIVFLSE